jgi:DNA-binding beta-propeller fold protein YncE
MKYQTLYKRILGVGLMLAFLTGCGASATQEPTLVTPISSPTVVLTSTESTSPTMEKVWETHGNPSAFHLPTELAIDPKGNVYVIDGGNHRVQKYDKAGNFLLTWGGLGAGDGQFMFQASPAHYGSITVDKDGYVYVTDHHNRVQKFDSNGTFLMKFGRTGYADGEFAALYNRLDQIRDPEIR